MLMIFGSSVVAVIIIPCWFICKKAGFSPWLSLLNIVPLGNLDPALRAGLCAVEGGAGASGDWLPQPPYPPQPPSAPQLLSAAVGAKQADALAS